ncbi:EamA domain-containing membrane protein RarD [Lachnospiraceae bacterium XBB2008]|nr:EamA domain-containing membrane protein RarD [Lachnospiraceae bacterium XBB2008]
MKPQAKGIICIIIAAMGFSLMTFFVRLSGDLPTMQKAFFRNAFALVIAVSALIINKEKFSIPKEFRSDIFFRCLFGTTGLIANFYAIDRLNLADANMLNKLSPFFAILVSIIILKEKPSKMDILATIIAFIGALFIIRPTGSNLELVPALIGLYGGFGAGTAYVFVRSAGKKGAKTPIIVTCFSLFSCILTLPFMVFSYAPMSPKQWLILILAGLSAAVGQFAITTAYRFAPAKKLSVFDYVQVIFAALWGFLFLHEVPVPLSIIGYVIIIGIAVIRWHTSLRAEE